ncbi:glycosyltransferase family 2 protein [Methylobacterium radiodurans]|uniref:Glycosyl transferase family 2 n=1 Tax=Methylobacterium radiodurans TaxID=2202828 RepID=A0A2U8VVJ1_9HYPH|nr:glycosyltransferase family 2 protein [Methylobacterium radiodurans]AWN37844.1 hypothetical protein DK427_20660 [Methylobacterium radiodurans]
MPRLRDTYFYLLENPGQRTFEACWQLFDHRTPTFVRPVYEAARRFRFATEAHAYKDWLSHGRALGLPYAPGRDTLLKIILKVKDEPELLARWIAYHAGIVGHHNLIIMDCGSTDPEHLHVLEAYRDRILIVGYERYYDTLHDTVENAAFYHLIEKNCRYVAVLDADEFLFARRAGTIGPDNVLPLLREGDEGVHAGTWFPNVAAPEEGQDGPDWTRPIRFEMSAESIHHGTVAGKAIVRSDLARAVGHVGHNLHVPEVAAQMRPGSFGRLGVLHVSRLGRRATRARVLKHLHARGLVSRTITEEDAVAHHLAQRLAEGGYDAGARHYAELYLGAGSPAAEPEEAFGTALIGGARSEPNPDLDRAIARFDFTPFLPR